MITLWKKWTSSPTTLFGLFKHCRMWGKLQKNVLWSRFGDASYHAQPILPKFGGIFCLCTTGPPNRLHKRFFCNLPHITQYLDNWKIVVRGLVHFFCIVTISSLPCCSNAISWSHTFFKYVMMPVILFENMRYFRYIFKTKNWDMILFFAEYFFAEFFIW